MAKDDKPGVQRDEDRHPEKVGIEPAMVSQVDMDQAPPNPERKDINPNEPIVPEKPV